MSNRRKAVLAILAGALAALGHAPFNLWPLALAGFGGLTWLVAASPTPRRAALIGWLGGIGYFATALHWIVQPFLVDVARHGWMAPFALVFLAAGLGLFWGAAGWLSARTGRRFIGWALALSLAELARGYVLTGFPWALPAYIWVETPALMAASLLGPYGLTLLTLLLVALPLAVPRRLMAGAGSAVLLAALMVWGWSEQRQSSDHVGTVRIVQPNAPQHEKWDPEKAPIFVERQIDFTAEPKTDLGLIVWPETAIPYRLDRAGPVLTRISQAAEGVPVILGANRSEGGRYFNALVALGKGGAVEDVYDKVHLVPFGEYIPLGQLARVVGMQSFAARDGFGFSPGDGVRLIDTPLGRALPLICYEAIFPQQIRKAPERPDYLLQITNDAWFGTFSGPYQHLQQAQFRAAEQGLPLVRSANTGVSAVIAPDGTIISELPLGEAGFLDVPLPHPRPPTIYSRIGDMPLAVLLFVVLSALILNQSSNTIANSRTTS